MGIITIMDTTPSCVAWITWLTSDWWVRHDGSVAHLNQ
jgi:hypothetical protein